MTKTKDKNPHLKETKDKNPHLKETKDKNPHLKETKDKELKGKNNLVGRVKKVIKKSRRKLGEEKFEKELQRTIEFLAQLQTKLDNSHSPKAGDKALAKVEKKSVRGAGNSGEKKVARNTVKKVKAKPSKKSVKKTAGNGAGRKRKSAAPLIKDVIPGVESRIALQAEAPEPQTGD